MSDEKQSRFVVRANVTSVTRGLNESFRSAEISRSDGTRQLLVTLYDSDADDPDVERGARLEDIEGGTWGGAHIWIRHDELGYLAKALAEARMALDHRHPQDAYTLLSELPTSTDAGLDDPDDHVEHIAL
jgi:hypothetical protein